MLKINNTNATLSRIWPHLMLLLLPLLASYILYASTATPYVKGKTEKAWKVLESFTYYVPWVDTIQYRSLWIQRILHSWSIIKTFFLHWAEKMVLLVWKMILLLWKHTYIIHLYGYSTVTRIPSEICWVVPTKGEVMWAIIAGIFCNVKNGWSFNTSKVRQWSFCCLQDKTWINMQILWNYLIVTSLA